MASNARPAVKLVTVGGVPVGVPASAADQGRTEYFCMKMEDDKPTECHGPFPSDQAAVDAVNEWYGDGEWYIAAKIKVVHKVASDGKAH